MTLVLEMSLFMFFLQLDFKNSAEINFNGRKYLYNTCGCGLTHNSYLKFMEQNQFTSNIGILGSLIQTLRKSRAKRQANFTVTLEKVGNQMIPGGVLIKNLTLKKSENEVNSHNHGSNVDFDDFLYDYNLEVTPEFHSANEITWEYQSSLHKSGGQKESEQTTVEDAPWQVVIVGKNRQKCSGAFINEKFILTSRRCTQMLGPNLRTFSQAMIPCRSANSKRSRIVKIIPSPDFDVAILKLSTKWKSLKNPNYPICLMQEPLWNLTSLQYGMISGHHGQIACGLEKEFVRFNETCKDKDLICLYENKAICELNSGSSLSIDLNGFHHLLGLKTDKKSKSLTCQDHPEHVFMSLNTRKVMEFVIKHIQDGECEHNK